VSWSSQIAIDHGRHHIPAPVAFSYNSIPTPHLDTYSTLFRYETRQFIHNPSDGMSRRESNIEYPGPRATRSDDLPLFAFTPAPYHEAPQFSTSNFTQAESYASQFTFTAPPSSVATSAGPSQINESTGATHTCTLPVIQGPRAGKECGATLNMDQELLKEHLWTCHNVGNNANLSRTRKGGKQILCPDDTCSCRFRAKGCARWPHGGDRLHHRTHVSDYLRHYKDVHLRSTSGEVPECQKCDRCGKKFTRSESVARHKKKCSSGKV
jgi:hypothetical protein